MKLPGQQISPERKMVYYAGLILMTIGIVSFLSTFVTAAMRFGDFTNFEARGRSEALRAFGGFILIIIGAALQGIGKKGLAGSGLLLDPEKTRKDLEPWNRMAGGMADDTLSEIGLVQKLEDHLDQDPATPAPQIKIRCRNCQSLNDETAKFCNQCGGQM